MSTLRQAIGLYVGLDIQHVAWVDLLGFAALVDAMGGVELCLPGVLADLSTAGRRGKGGRASYWRLDVASTTARMPCLCPHPTGAR